MRSLRNVIAFSLTVSLALFVGACSDDSKDATQETPSSSNDGPSNNDPSQLSEADVAKATAAVKDNWETCIAAAGASSSSVTVEPIDDTKTGRPVDEGKRPVVVHVQWEGKEADFLVALEGQLTGAALFGDVSNAMVAEAKAAGGDC
jgi:hypothetical protein